MSSEHASDYVVTSHETISHKDLDNLGYDWTRAADPDVAPRRPRTVYFPTDTKDVSEILAASAGERERQRTPAQRLA